MKLKIQTRILIFYVAAFIAFIGIFIFSIATIMSDNIFTNGEELIRSEAEETVENLYVASYGPFYIGEDETFRYLHDNVVFTIMLADEVAFGTVPAVELADAPMMAYQIQTLEDSSGTQWLIYDVPLNNGYSLRSYYSLSNSVSTIQQMIWIMLIAAPFLIFLASIGGYLIIKHSLKPLRVITSTAESIKNNQSYGLRVDYVNTKDEVSQLAGMLNEMLDKVESAISREREFSTNVSHELRTPLAVLRAQAEYLMTKTSDPVVIADTQSMLIQLKFMESLVNQFLELSRIRHIQPQELEDMNMATVIDVVTQSLQPMMEERGITCSVRPAAKECVLRTSETAVVRILHNILSNAIKYNKQNGSITISCDSTPTHCMITIVDTGIGMSESDVSKAFDPFFRADHSRTLQEGLGVGLSLTKELVHLLGGTIKIESQLAKGTTVVVALPYHIN